MSTSPLKHRVRFVNDHPAPEEFPEDSVVEKGSLERVLLSGVFVLAVFFVVALVVFGPPASWGAR